MRAYSRFSSFCTSKGFDGSLSCSPTQNTIYISLGRPQDEEYAQEEAYPEQVDAGLCAHAGAPHICQVVPFTVWLMLATRRSASTVMLVNPWPVHEPVIERVAASAHMVLRR